MTRDVEEELARAVAAIEQATVLALACHVWPDGDALGSMLALHHLAAAEGRASVASWSEPEQVAPHYAFLPGLDTVTKAADFPASPEVMVTFDSGSLERLGTLVPSARAAGELIVVDHHAGNTRYGSINVIDPDAAATAVIVRNLARRLGWALNRDAALCIYTGLVTDTGRFQYANTTPEVFALAEELARFDLPVAFLTRELFEKHRLAYLRLVADVLARVELDPGTGMVFAWVSQEDLDRHGVGLDETEGLIDLVRRTAEARVAMVAKESPSGVRVSLRALDDTDVGAVATALGGGGHRFASGFVWPGSLAAAGQAVREALARAG
jgi:phosphoesterase RecJ-like protein